MTLRAIKISKSFGDKPVVQEVTTEIPMGRVTLFSGPSGIGKSTILEMLSGLMKPGSGTVERDLPLAYMFQDNALIPWLTAEKNLSYILPKSMKKPQIDEKTAYWLDFFELEGSLLPHELSGGMKRRLNLARTFLSERPIILLDEPFAFLDDEWIRKVSALIKERTEKGSAIALASHGQNEALREAVGNRLITHEINASPIVLRPS